MKNCALRLTSTLIIAIVHLDMLAGYQQGGFPAIPWLTVPQRWVGAALPLPNPPIYAAVNAPEVAQKYSDYRWDMFYEHPTDAPTTANETTTIPGAAGAPPGNPCTAPGSGNGVCVLQAMLTQNCKFRQFKEAPECKFNEQCCLDVDNK